MATAPLASDAVVPPDQSEADRLGALWAEAYEGWVSPPGSASSEKASAIYLFPWTEGSNAASAEGECSANWEPWVEETMKLADVHGGLFALTAYNPMGQDRPDAENVVKNLELEKEIRALCAESPDRVWWRSFGFATDWHEKGFTVAAPKDMILQLAKKYGQGAIFRFYRNAETSACPAPIMKATIPALLDSSEADVPMVPIPRPGLPRADPDWTPDA